MPREWIRIPQCMSFELLKESIGSYGLTAVIMGRLNIRSILP